MLCVAGSEGEMVMDDNPGSDGKVRTTIVVAIAVFIAWNAPYAWYWRAALVLAITFLFGIVYPAILLALARRKQRG